MPSSPTAEAFSGEELVVGAAVKMGMEAVADGLDVVLHRVFLGDA